MAAAQFVALTDPDLRNKQGQEVWETAQTVGSALAWSMGADNDIGEILSVMAEIVDGYVDAAQRLGGDPELIAKVKEILK